MELGTTPVTDYTYDLETFRLVHLVTTAAKGRCQDLGYTYDPVGNITRIEDLAQQEIYFNNSFIPPVIRYRYDATYRLVHAHGREHVIQTGDPYQTVVPTFGGLPSDWAKMREYDEEYAYDSVGNILSMIHTAMGGSWRRNHRYAYMAQSDAPPPPDGNRLMATSAPGDQDGVYSKQQYAHDDHGNLVEMPHLTAMTWDWKEQMQSSDHLGGGRVFYTYDTAGQRVRKVVETEVGILDKDRVYLGGYETYREFSNGAVFFERQTVHAMDDRRRIAMIETRVTDGGAPVLKPKPQLRYELGDHLGSASLELDESSGVISYEEYHPYGTTAYWATDPKAVVSGKRYRYTGKERDEESGLSYHGARYLALLRHREGRAGSLGFSTVALWAAG